MGNYASLEYAGTSFETILEKSERSNAIRLGKRSSKGSKPRRNEKRNEADSSYVRQV